MSLINIIHDRRLLLLRFLPLLLLGACAPAAAPTVPPPPPTAVTAAQQPDAPLLPDTLYVLENGQIARIAADARNREVVTDEPTAREGQNAISSFDLLPDGGLVYIAATLTGSRLVEQRGTAATARVIFEQPNLLLDEVVATPAGDAVIVYVRDAGEQPTFAAGLYRIELRSGALTEVLQDPVQRVDAMVPPESTRAVSLNRDGSLLLIHERNDALQQCQPALLNTAGTIIRPQIAAAETVFCGEEQWLPDGSGVLLLAGAADAPGVQLLAGDGSLRRLTPDGIMARAPWPLADGGMALLVVESQADGWQFQPALLSADGRLTREGELTRDIPLYVSWTADGSGYVAVVQGAQTPELRYVQRSDGAFRRIPQSPAGVSQLRWAAGR